ncbi:MAG: zinc ribbon domain-containing protein [Clostridia bacterium]|nr:zinc ribbon domain-containing protein [Clostridia bacterium]
MTTIYNKPLGMAWYKFLIYFALVFGAIINIVGGFMTIISIFQGDAYYSWLYDLNPALRIIDVLYELFVIAMGVFGLVVRHKLANYDPDAPILVKIFFLINVCVPFLYTIIVAVITQHPIFIAMGLFSPIYPLIVLLANIKYFNKRAHLFVGKKETAQAPTVTSETRPQRASFCRKCGAKLAADSNFCQNCGTKI